MHNGSKIMHRVAAAAISLSGIGPAFAGDVEVLAAEWRTLDNRSWSVNVTLRHTDTGWDHYADAWRIVDAEGEVLGERVLYHPHVDEQPFTRGLDGVSLPTGTTRVFIEAHDKLHGWSPDRLEIDLSRAKDGRVRVEKP